MFGARSRKKLTHRDLYSRIGIFAAIIAVLFIVLSFRLFDVQILNNEKYSTQSSNNQIRVLTTPAKRGCIYDSNMNVLADSSVVFAVSVDVTNLSSDEKDLVSKNLAGYLKDPSITEESIREQLSAGTGGYEPIVIKRVNYKDYIGLISVLEEHRSELPGLYISEEPQRTYPQNEVAGHVIGYVGSLSDTDQELIDEYNYQSTDMIGKSGLEKTMERFTDDEGNEIGLRGIRGVKTVEVDSNHNIIRTISEEQPVSGNSMILTINSTVQKAMQDSLANVVTNLQGSYTKCKGGAAVMIDVKTGGIIAMASYPSLNPNDFIEGMDQETSDYYLNNDGKPLLNKAMQTAYPTGSTFKPSTAIAALITDSITPQTSVVCKESTWIPPMASCTGEHYTVNLSSAMAVSCNTYFQTIGKLAGIDKMYPVFKKLGYGQLTGIELPSEQRGVLANKEWKEQNFDEPWRIYDTFYMSMGQGYINNTVLQMANATATMANGGNRMQPYLVSKIINSYNDTVYQKAPSVIEEVGGDPEDYQAVKDAMRTVCTSGTASRLFGSYPVKVCAKTGTAQTGLKADDPDSDYHGWFVAFAPYDDPQVAFAGIVEYGKHGSTSAGYVCRDAFSAYFGLNGQSTSYGINLFDSNGNLVDSTVVE
ncbi:MAG: penicillin-binding protein 2 [Bacillota bacterium]|jgi:penicillin-binding protein 2